MSGKRNREFGYTVCLTLQTKDGAVVVIHGIPAASVTSRRAYTAQLIPDHVIMVGVGLV